MWHATPFEERLAQALATQQDSVPQRYKEKNSSMAAQPAHEVILVLLVLYHDFYLF